MSRFIVGIDIGGTFADAVAIDEQGNIVFAKCATTPEDLSICTLGALDELSKKVGSGSNKDFAQNIYLFNHSGTGAVNTVIQRTGAKTALLTTRGFESILPIMRSEGRYLGLSEDEIKAMNKVRKPRPIVPRPLIRGVTERVDYKGEILLPLNHEEVRGIVKKLVEEDRIEAIAVCLLWSFKNPSHERKIAEIINKEYPEIPVSISSEIVPRIGEYE